MKVLAVLVWLLLVCFLPHYFQGWYQLAFYIAYTLVLWFGSTLLESRTRFGAYISGFVWGLWWHVRLSWNDDDDFNAPVHCRFKAAMSRPVLDAFARGFSYIADRPFVVNGRETTSKDSCTHLVLVAVLPNTGAHMK